MSNIQRTITRVKQSRFARNVAIVALGTAGSQAITIFFSPIITRIYGPESFGLLGVFLAVTAIFTPVAALTYPTAIVLPKKDCEAKILAKLSFIVALIVSLVTACVLFYWGSKLLEVLNAESISVFIMVIPIAMFFDAMLQISQQWLIRKKQFKTTARIAVIHSVITNFSKTIFGWLNPVAAVLIIVTLIGTALRAFMSWIAIKQDSDDYLRNQQATTTKSLVLIAKEYRDFSIFRAPQVFINAATQSLPVLMLAIFFGSASAGFYSLGRMVLAAPASLIAKSFGDVLYPRIIEATHAGENAAQLIIKATLILTAVGFIPFAVIVAFGPWLFAMLFGQEWLMAGEYARWLALWLYFGFINTPCVISIPVFSLQAKLLFYDLFGIVGRLLALFIGFHYFTDEIYGIIFFSIFGILWNILLVLYVISYSKRANKK